MRTWRVGTFSMGLSLVFLGVFLLFTQFFDWKIVTVLKVWWPIILVILGIEILLYLFSSKQEKPYLSFDLFSIIIVGIIGTAGIAMVFLQSSGIMDLVEQGLKREEVTSDLPEFNYAMKDDIKRIVIESDNRQNPITIEGTNDDVLSLFGTYRAVQSKKEDVLKPEDYLLVSQKGDTLFIRLKQLPYRVSEFYRDYASINTTILVPTSKKLDIIDLQNDITVNPRNLKNNWTINNVPQIDLILDETKNVKVSVDDTLINNQEQEDWEFPNKEKKHIEEITNAFLQKGKGGSSINIFDSGTLNVTNH
ncbi:MULTISPECIES: hypothetical protein [Niallia]|jgi:hypothetical protein|uniref:Uncharacterized protein n=1 Tax=Niallia circulans TaxID=1397 RepID=A0A268F7E8_NIACI|nr:hypothetical protein [Niallia circulans]AYV69273.1 hypothetical protein C2I06_21870 [Niallia circulans]AYV72329.1 hypothetical protein C2H98_12465 [Niallia circulans]NRG26166.1 hypothetical protein [Niallia circulans]PAD81268.1 hypothetical protein CHH57_20915 [Niallia circulans]QJX60734.1 hypothetical protein HLK66_03090 [Niallia circulans]